MRPDNHQIQGHLLPELSKPVWDPNSKECTPENEKIEFQKEGKRGNRHISTRIQWVPMAPGLKKTQLDQENPFFLSILCNSWDLGLHEKIQNSKFQKFWNICFLIITRSHEVGFGRNLVEIDPMGPPDLSKQPWTLKTIQKTSNLSIQMLKQKLLGFDFLMFSYSALFPY